jgi:predicted glycosyltransferase
MVDLEQTFRRLQQMPMKPPRVLLFCHDATGLGHLRRISRIASFLQGECSCLVVTGMEQAHWMVSKPCELIKLPNWDTLIKERAAKRQVSLWMDVSTHEACRLKEDLLRSVAAAYRPDCVLVDYLPFGLRGELRDLLETTPARKYLIHRGIADLADRDVLYGEASRQIARVYDRIVVTADRRLVQVETEYGFVEAAAAKTMYVGFVDPHAVTADRHSVMNERSRPPLVVCSCGGGLGGEEVFAACVAAAEQLRWVEFHIVLGPYGTMRTPLVHCPSNCHIHNICENLDLLHRRASLVITHGGYNSVTEAISGGARILVCHIQGGDQDERITFEKRLSSVYPIRAVADLARLPQEIEVEISAALGSGTIRFPWDFGGLPGIRNVLKYDLAINECRAVRA